MSLLDVLTLSYAGIIFHDFMSAADILSKLAFSKNSFRNIIRLDPDQARLFVGADLVETAKVIGRLRA